MKQRTREQGISLIAMLVIVILVGGVASAFMLLSTTESRSVEMSRYKMRATYLAEAAAEDVANMIRTLYASELIPVKPKADPTIPTSGTIVVNGATVNFTWYQTHPTDETQNLIRLNGTVAIDATHNMPAIPFVATQYLEIPKPNITGTLSTQRMYYEIAVETRFQGTLGRVARIVEIRSTPLFQFLAFYNGDLEFLPGPPFVGHGRIHTNGDMYIGAGSSVTMFTDHMHALGQIYRHRKNNGSYTDNAGPLIIYDTAGASSVTWGTDPSTDESGTDLGSSSTPNSNWPTSSAGLQAKGVKNGATGAQQIETPSVGSLDPFTGFFAQQAASSGLIIRDNEVVRLNPSTNTYVVDSAATSALQASGAITTDSISDRRENTSSRLPVTVIDMEKLKASAYYPVGGVLYAFRTGNPPSAGDPLEGVVFKNGDNLQQTPGQTKGITLASNGPVYVQGDFNAPRVYDGEGDPIMSSDGTYQQDSTKKVPAAVIADAVNLLSNNWDNTKNPNPTDSMKRATPTNYNFAMITGNVPTPDGGGAYSGGLENLPRFHEDWNYDGSKKAVNFKGAMINLWASQYAKGLWGQAGVYDPPARNWDFDEDFDDSSRPPPPAFPSGVQIGRTVYEENYRAP